MENSTKEKIKNTCQEKATISIPQPDFFSRSSDIMHSYEVQENGAIIKNTYKVIRIKCDGFGCNYPEMEMVNTETLGNCDELNFLDLL